MTNTGPEPDSPDTPTAEPDYDTTQSEPVRDPFEEAVVDEETEDPDDDAGVAGG